MPSSGRRWHKAAMLLHKYYAILNPLGAQEAERETERLHPERETLLLAAAGAAKVLGPDHTATRAFAKAAASMDRVDLWHARLTLLALPLEPRADRADTAEALVEVSRHHGDAAQHCAAHPFKLAGKPVIANHWPSPHQRLVFPGPGLFHLVLEKPVQ